MRYHHRHVEKRLSRMADRFPILVLGGARQTGKSTLLARLFGDRARTFVFDPVVDVGDARRDPELFLHVNPPPLILDEVQYAPELLSVLKRTTDARPGEKGLYFLTGSQQLQVLKSVRESLAGRAFVMDLWPMSDTELSPELRPGLLDILYSEARPPDARELLARLAERAPPSTSGGALYEKMFRGGYPGLMEFRTDEVIEWFSSYLRTYVERDVRTLRDLSEPHDFTRFVRLCAALSAQEVNFAKLGREIGVTPKTARGWLKVMSASYQSVFLDAYSGNTVKRISGKPKMYTTDTGFACFLLSISSPNGLGSHPRLGALFETYVVTEILKHLEGLPARPRVWHWRARSGAEVDLLLERDGIFVALEIKLAARPSRRDLSGLRAFRDTYPHLDLALNVVVHGGSDLYLLDDQSVALPVAWI